MLTAKQFHLAALQTFIELLLWKALSCIYTRKHVWVWVCGCGYVRVHWGEWLVRDAKTFIKNSADWWVSKSGYHNVCQFSFFFLTYIFMNETDRHKHP